MKLDEKTRELIAVGASVSAHSQPCLEYHRKKALESGSDGEEIAEEIERGRGVRKGAATNMDQFVAELGKVACRNGPDKSPSPGCCS